MKTIQQRAGAAALCALALVASTVILAESAGARDGAGTVGIVTQGPARPAPYTVNASVSVGTSTPAPGARLTVSGKRFRPGERVSVKIDVTSHMKFDTNMRLRTLTVVRAGPLGGFSTRVRVPDRARGTHWIVAKGLWSKRVASTKITICGCG